MRGVALVDDLIMRRWKEDLVRHPQLLALRDDAGNTYRFPLRSGPNLGTHLLLPPDLKRHVVRGQAVSATVQVLTPSSGSPSTTSPSSR